MRFLFEGGKIHEEVYHDLPIKPRYGYPIPEQIRSMRALEKQEERMGVPRVQSFVKMARLMSGFEDDFHYDKTVCRRSPAYDSLSDIELRGYFGWRTRYKRGENEPAGSYAEIYMSELLNGIGASNTEDALIKLQELKKRCGHYLPNAEKLITDFVIYNNLNSEYICESAQFESDRNISVILGNDMTCQRENCTDETATREDVGAGCYDIAQACNEIKIDNDMAVSISRAENRLDAVIAVSYFFRLKEIRSFREHRKDFAVILNRCFEKTINYSREKRNKDFFDEILGRPSIWPYVMFSGAVVDASGKEEGYEYRINPVRTVFYKNAHWSVKRYAPDEKARKTLQDFIAAVFLAYEEFRVSHEGLHNAKILGISDLKTPVWMKKLIEGEIRSYFEEKRLVEERRVKIDYSKLEAIRENAAAVRDKLIVDEEAEKPEDESKQRNVKPLAGESEQKTIAAVEIMNQQDILENDNESGIMSDPVIPDSECEIVEVNEHQHENGSACSNEVSNCENESGDVNLTDFEKQVLSAVLKGESTAFVREQGQMLSVVIDDINEKLYDIFGDSVIYDDGTLKIYEDYISDIEEMLG